MSKRVDLNTTILLDGRGFQKLNYNVLLRVGLYIDVCLFPPPHHVVPDGTSVVVCQRTGGLVKERYVRVGEVVHAGSSTREAHYRAVPSRGSGPYHETMRRRESEVVFESPIRLSMKKAFRYKRL